MVPSSRFAGSLKPSVAYLDLNFCAGWKKQMILPSLAYAGIPYQVLGVRPGALALMMAWTRSPRARSASVISAIFASRSLSPSAWAARGPRRAAVFSSWACSFMAARSSAVNPADVLLFAVVLLADFCVSFIAGFLPTSLDGTTLMLGSRRAVGFFKPARSFTWVNPASIGSPQPPHGAAMAARNRGQDPADPQRRLPVGGRP